VFSESTILRYSAFDASPDRSQTRSVVPILMVSSLTNYNFLTKLPTVYLPS